jgi:hypothetical protein
MPCIKVITRMVVVMVMMMMMIIIIIIIISKGLEIDISRMWKVRTKTVPVILGGLGTIKKGLDQNLQLLQGHRSVTEQLQITVMSTAHCMH